MFCRKCGKQLSDGAKFCAGCGAKIEVPAAVPASDPAAKAPRAELPVIAPAAEAPRAELPVIAPAAEAPKEEAPVSAPAAEAPKEEAPVSAPAAEAPKEEAPVSTPAAEAQKAELPVIAPAKKKGKGLVAAAIVVAALAAGGGGAAWYLTSPGFVSGQNMKKAAAAMEQQEYEEALDYYSAALDKDDTLLDAYLNSADIYVTLGKQDAAIKLLQKAKKNFSDNEQVIAQLQDKTHSIYVAQIRSVFEKGELDAAKELAVSALEAFPGDTEIKNQMSSIYCAEIDASIQQKEYDQAFEQVKRARDMIGEEKVSAKNADIYLAWAQDLIDKKEMKSALETLRIGYEATQSKAVLEKEAVVYSSMADEWIAEGRISDAAEFLARGAEETKDQTLLQKIEMLAKNVSWDTRKEYRNGRLYEEVQYDDKDRVIKDVFYDSSERITSVNMTEYNKDLITKMVSAYYSYGWYSGQSISTVLYIYDEKDREIAVYYYDTDELEKPTNYTQKNYDENGNLASILYFDGDGKKTAESIYTYDEKGFLISDVDYDDNKFSYKTVYVRDDNGNAVKEEYYAFTEDSQRGSSTREYDEKNRLLHEIYSGMHEFTEEKLEYDEADRIIHRWYQDVSYQGGTTSTSDEYFEYDAAGNLLTEKRTYDYDVEFPDDWSQPFSSTTVNTYQYDEKGNVIVYEHTYDGPDNEYYAPGYQFDGYNEYFNYTIHYTYDAEGRLTLMDIDDGYASEVHEYDSTGNEIYSCSKYKDGQIAAENKARYNAFGDLVSSYCKYAYDTYESEYTYNYLYTGK